MYLLHNDLFIRVTPGELAQLQGFWKTHDAHGVEIPPQTKIDDKLFAGSLAAGYFIPQ